MPGSATTIDRNNPPLPSDNGDDDRRKQSALRYRIMSGAWEADLINMIGQHFDAVRSFSAGRPDMSTNLMDSVIRQLAALYTAPPLVTNPDGGQPAEALIDGVAEAGWWQMATRNQRYVLGMRESLAIPVWVESQKRIMFRLVVPSEVYAEAPPDDPDHPSYIVEARVREWPAGSGKEVWTWDVVDLRGDTPEFKVVIPHGTAEARRMEDITEKIHGKPLSGPDYPWLDASGKPVMPYVLYHAERTGYLWDAFNGREMVDGTLTVAVLWTFWLHCVKDASWPQRYILNAVLRGKAKAPKGGPAPGDQAFVPLDPASIAQFRSDGGGEAATIGQFGPGHDPDKLGKALADFEMRIGVHLDLGSNDFQRSGSAESGYAISLKSAAVRQAQRRYEPQFRLGDTELLRVAAVTTNNATGSAIPEDGYNITYQGLPFTPQEVAATLAEHEKLMAMGLESKVDAFIRLHPGTERESAVKLLKEIADENRLFGMNPSA